MLVKKNPCDRISLEQKKSDSDNTETSQVLLSDQNNLFGYLYFIMIRIGQIKYQCDQTLAFHYSWSNRRRANPNSYQET